MENNLNKQISQATKWSGITEIATKLLAPITNIILARLLTPEAFGVVATLTMVVTFAEIFTDAGFQKYLVQHQFTNQSDLTLSTNVAFWTNLAVSLLVWFGIACFATPIAILVGSPGCEAAIIVMSAEIPLLAFSSIQMARYRREFDFKNLFYARMATALVPLVVTVPAALVFRSYWALVIGTLAKDFINAVILTVKSPWKPSLAFDLSKLREMLSFSIWTIVENVAIWLTSNVDILIVGTVLSSHYLGLYKTAMTTSNSYLNLIVSAVVPVLFSALSRCQDDENAFREVFLRFQRLMSIIVIPLGFGLFVFQEVATMLLLGGQWMETASFLGTWSLCGSLTIIYSHINSEVFRSKGEPKISVLVQVLHMAALIPAVMWTADKGYEILTLTRSLLRLEIILVSGIILQIKFGIKATSVIKNTWPALVSAMVMSIAGMLLKSMTSSLLWQIVAIIICCAVYFAFMLIIPAGRKQLAEIPVIKKILRLNENAKVCRSI